MHEHGRHHRVGRLLLEDLVLEVGHAAVGPCERLVVDDRYGGRRGRDHRRDGRTGLELYLRAPVLHALGEGVIGALRHREAVDELERAAVDGLDGLLEVFHEELAA